MLTRKKRILFTLTPIILCCFLLVMIEYALRAFAPSLDNPLYSPVTQDGVHWYQVNRSYLAKYFPANVTAIPEFKPGRFKAIKGKETFRIVCIGESSMFGTPYAMSATIPAILRKQLRHLYPERNFEVINLGAAAINSNAILDITRHLFRMQPDLILLYAGHNEFYGPDGVGAGPIERTFPFTISLKYNARELRLVKALQNLLRSMIGTSAREERNMMRQVSEESHVRLDSPEAERVFRNLGSNLTQIAELCKTHGVPLIVSDVTSNLLFPPFAYDTVSVDSKQTGLIAGTPAMFRSGHLESLVETLTPIAGADSTNAFVDYWLGRALLAGGDVARGKTFLKRARDNDLLKFRAPGRTNTIIRAVCASSGVPCVSADSVFASFTASGMPGDTLFWEHLHPNARGYYEIASLFLKEIIRLGIIPHPSTTTQQGIALPYDSDSLSIPWLDHAYADLSMRFLTSRWPFMGYEVASYVYDAAEAPLQQIASAVYKHTVGWNDGCYQIAAYFGSRGVYRAARTTYESLLEEYTEDYRTFYLLGNLEKENGHFAEATERYARTISLNPGFELPRIDLALLLINAGDPDGAILQLTVADSLVRGRDVPLVRATILYGLSASYANKRDFPRAVRLVEESLKLAPAYQPAQILRNNLAKYFRSNL